jgi:hypothetical protein
MAQRFGIPKKELGEIAEGLASDVGKLLDDLDSPPILPLQNYK